MHKNKDVVARLIQDQIVLVPISYSAEGLFAYHLDEVGSFLWNCLDESTSVSELANKLVSEFEIDLETATRDVNHFIGELKEHQILL